MRFSGVSAIAIWNSAIRTLTSLGSSIFLTFSSVNQSLAASATVGIGPGASKLRMMSIGLKAGAAGSVVAQLADGTNVFIFLTVASATSAGFADIVNMNLFSVQLKNNDAANAATWSMGGVDWGP